MKKISKGAITIIFLVFIVMPIIAIGNSPVTETTKTTKTTPNNINYYEYLDKYKLITPMPTFDLSSFDFSYSLPELTLKVYDTPLPTPSPTSIPENIPWKKYENMVFVSKYNKIHKNPNCSGMKECYIMEFDEAIEQGYILCQKCY
jgi:hypothetical protein